MGREHHPMTSTNAALSGADFWEDRYASGTLTWSGKVNDLLALEVEALTPGRALDLGCGTGGDAIWLARLGWRVTGVDIAQAALAQAARHATEAAIADQITWEHHDFEESFPTGRFDLVSACYLQSPVAFQRLAALRLAAGAVAQGGTLAVISHESTPGGGGHVSASMPTARQLLGELALATDDWELVKAQSVPRRREIKGADVEYRDNVLRLRRR